MLGHAQIFVSELLLAGHLQFFYHSEFLGSDAAFLLTSSPFSLLEGSLGAESIDLGLSVGCLLLQISQTLNFSFLLFLNSLFLGGEFSLFSSSLPVVFNDFKLSLLLLLLFDLLLGDGISIGFLNFFHHLRGLLFLLLGNTGFLLLLFLDIPKQLLLLFLKNFLFSKSFLLSLSDLVDDDSGTLVGCLLAGGLSLLVQLEVLQSLNLHHEVKFLLLLEIFFLETLVFLLLLVSDGDNLAVEHHLVHVLHIIVLFIDHLLGLREKRLGFLGGLDVGRSRRNLGSALSVVLLHSGLARLVLSEHLLFLLAHDLSLLYFLFTGLNLG